MSAATRKGYNRLDHNLLHLLSLSSVSHCVLNISPFTNRKRICITVLHYNLRGDEIFTLRLEIKHFRVSRKEGNLLLRVEW